MTKQKVRELFLICYLQLKCVYIFSINFSVGDLHYIYIYIYIYIFFFFLNPYVLISKLIIMILCLHCFNQYDQSLFRHLNY